MPTYVPKTWWERLYLPAIAVGLAQTMRHMLRAVFRRGIVTVQYPEKRLELKPGFRGEHILKKDAQGRPKCTACYLCATACPSECIHIEAMPAPWPDRDKVPAVFEIDMLRCIYCGFCEEACPCDAIELTPKPYTVMTSRDEAVYAKDKLLGNIPLGYVPPDHIEATRPKPS